MISVSTEAVSDWCEELAQRISDLSSPGTRRPVAEMNEESESRISLNVVLILTNPLSINVPVQGGLLRRHNKRFDNLQEDMRVRKSWRNAKDFSWSIFHDDP